MSQGLTTEQVHEAFLASPPLIADTILDLSYQHPNWLGSLWKLEDWPAGNGTTAEQIVFRGGLPPVERGFGGWKKLGNASGCAPVQGPDCSYNWTQFGGYGLDRKITELMSRDFRTPEYCINEIQTSAQFREVFAQIMQNIYRQVDFYKEQNIGMNYLTMLSKKFVVDSGGAKCNTNDPYVYRNIGATRLSTLNIELLTFFYEHLRRIPDCIPYDVIDGQPIYALECSAELLGRLYRDDPALRQDVRFSAYATDLLTKYNFQSVIRQMFIPAPILYPRRCNIVNGEPFEVLPTLNGIPAEVGSYSYLNPAWEAATHEELLIHGMWPFKLWQFPTQQALPDGATFGPEPTFLESWKWVNPETNCDPFRRVGYFASAAKIGLASQFSEGIYGILLERPSVTLMAMYTPNPVCPVTPPNCNNEVPAVTCPCPLLVSTPTVDPFHANTYFFQFTTPVTGTVGDDVTLQLNNGLGIVGDLAAVADNNMTVSITFDTPLDPDVFPNIIGVLCTNFAGCSSTVNFATDCRSNQTGTVNLLLQNAIKAVDVEDVIIAYFGDCTTAELEVVSVDVEKLVWTVQYGEGYGPTDDPTGAGYTVLSADMICNRNGIAKVCVPPTTDATCPACTGTTTPCVDIG